MLPPANRLELTLSKLERWGSIRDWIGPDPYEALNSPLGRMMRGRRPRQAAVQIYKRLPFSPPPPLRAPCRPNAKVAGLVLSGYATPAGRRLGEADRFLQELPNRLRELDLRPKGASAWGYHFDVQVRHLFYPRTEPNAIATCFAVNGLLDAAKATGAEEPLHQALSARPWLVRLCHDSPHGPFFAYVGSGSELIHNASMMVAGTLARLDAIEPDAAVRDTVAEVSRTTLRLQRDDGLWDYGEADNLRWADNFHTAYTLQGLLRVTRSLPGLGETELRRGLGAWLDAFIDHDGWCRYFPASRYPLEPHSAASAIDLLVDVASEGAIEDPLQIATDIGRTAVDALWLEDHGCFAHRRTARGLNRRIFMRWTNAPMFAALSRLVPGER